MSHFKGNIHNIETFGTFDGPGIRYVLFLQGCPFQCQFCHNRDSWSTNINNLMSVEEVLEDYRTYASFYKDGGITISGGEPLMQKAFVLALAKACKKAGIHVTLDTSGGCFSHANKADVMEILEYVDLVLLDVKHVDETAHINLTKRSNQAVYHFLSTLNIMKKETIIRHVLIPTINDDFDTLNRLKASLQPYTCIKRIEVLPYHVHGRHKWDDMGVTYPLENIPPMDKKEAETVQRFLNQNLYYYASKDNIKTTNH